MGKFSQHMYELFTNDKTSSKSGEEQRRYCVVRNVYYALSSSAVIVNECTYIYVLELVEGVLCKITRRSRFRQRESTWLGRRHSNNASRITSDSPQPLLLEEGEVPEAAKTALSQWFVFLQSKLCNILIAMIMTLTNTHSSQENMKKVFDEIAPYTEISLSKWRDMKGEFKKFHERVLVWTHFRKGCLTRRIFR